MDQDYTESTEPRRPGRPRLNHLPPTEQAATPGHESPAERARRRAMEIMQTATFESVGENKFDIPLNLIPDGWDYMWVRASTYGRTDAAFGADNMKNRRATGWEPVPASRHPELLPSDQADRSGYIEREGLILMERPLIISETARKRDEMQARRQMKDKETELGLAGANEGERLRSKIEQSVEPLSIPER